MIATEWCRTGLQKGWTLLERRTSLENHTEYGINGGQAVSKYGPPSRGLSEGGQAPLGRD
jgi:hypothetical protein